MRRFLILVLLPCFSSQADTKSLTETDDAYILDVDLGKDSSKFPRIIFIFNF